MEVRITMDDTKFMVLLAFITGVSLVGLALAYGGSSPTTVGHSFGEMDFPPGTVMLFKLSSCPAGWTELTEARGRYLVGLPSGGTLGGVAGTALTNIENRSVGQHTHALTSELYVPLQTGSTPYGYPAHIPTYGFTTTPISISNAGAVPGTNAPYIQLLVCMKN